MLLRTGFIDHVDRPNPGACDLELYGAPVSTEADPAVACILTEVGWILEIGLIPAADSHRIFDGRCRLRSVFGTEGARDPSFK